MKRLLTAILVIGAIGYGAIAAGPTEASPAAAASSATSSASDDQVSRAVVEPHFIQCDSDQICTTTQTCTQLGGIRGGGICNSAGWHCCLLN